MQSSKDKVYELLEHRTQSSNISDESLFQASSIASELFISRTLASQYLNALHADGLIIKVSGRPALFYSKSALEQRYQVDFLENTFLSVQELTAWMTSHSRMKYDFEDVIGASTTLRHVVAQIKAAACYPPRGLPLLLVGSIGSGRSGIRQAAEKWCVSERIVDGAIPSITLDAAAYGDPSQLAEALFGKQKEGKGLLAEYPHTLFWITNCQMIDPVTWEAILSYFGNGHEKEPPPVPQSRSRLFFQCTATPEEVITSAWAKRIPIIAYMPCFEDRSLEDREALAVKAFFKESNNIGKQVLASSVVLHELASRSYSDGLVGLEASMSRKLLIATHGYLANGFKSSIEVLVGTSVGIDTINAYTEEGGEDYSKSITRFLESVGPEDEGVILTDIVGGSVNQKVLQTLHRNEPNIFIISGTNLITALAVYLEDRPLTKDVVKEIVDQAKVQLIELPTSFESGSDEEDDFF